MVRLEKIAYEQLVNSQMLKRSRVLGSPSKWYSESRHQVQKVNAYKIFCTGLTGKVAKLFEPLVSKFTYQWTRDYAAQRGLALEDILLFQERELRRCVLFENVMRQGFHPYQWILFRARRARYYKVERGLRGFFVPEYARKEGMDRLLSDTLVNKEVFEEYRHQNYQADQTPTTRNTVLPKIIPLEAFNMYGWFRNESWDRLFFNEVYYAYDRHTEADYKAAQKPFNYNLDSESGRKEFEEEVNRFVKLYPGAVVKEGEKFNFQEYYVSEAIQSGKDLSKFDQATVQKLKSELQNFVAYHDKDVKQIGGPQKKTGTILPDFLRPKSGRAFH